MSLDHANWMRLLKGTILATQNNRMVWSRMQEEASSMLPSVGIATLGSIGTLGKPRTLFSTTASHLYVLTADSFGRAPFELTIRGNKTFGGNIVAHYKSSTRLTDPANMQVNQKLQELYQAASESIGKPSEIVDELLGEIGEE